LWSAPYPVRVYRARTALGPRARPTRGSSARGRAGLPSARPRRPAVPRHTRAPSRACRRPATRPHRPRHPGVSRGAGSSRPQRAAAGAKALPSLTRVILAPQPRQWRRGSRGHEHAKAAKESLLRLRQQVIARAHRSFEALLSLRCVQRAECKELQAVAQSAHERRQRQHIQPGSSQPVRKSPSSSCWLA